MLHFTTDIANLPGLWATIRLTPRFGTAGIGSARYEHQLVETVVAPRSPLVGRLITELPVREPPPFEAKLVAISREGKAPAGPIEELRVQASDNWVLRVEDAFFYECETRLNSRSPVLWKDITCSVSIELWSPRPSP